MNALQKPLPPEIAAPTFLSELDVRIVDDDDFELLADLIYASKVLDGVLTVPKGFHTDFASVPRVPGAYLLAGGKAKWEAVVHDYLCDHPEICARETADAVFHEAMGVRAFTKKPQAAWRRGLMWVGVRIGAAQSAVKRWLDGDEVTTKGQP